MPDGLQDIINRVRRLTRNGDVLTICDELQRRLISPTAASSARPAPAKPKLTRAQIQKNYRIRKKAIRNKT